MANESHTELQDRAESAAMLHISPPTRWDQPFGDKQQFTPEMVQAILRHEPFSLLAAENFPTGRNFHDLLLNDGRITHYQRGDIITHVGAYGSSCFLLLSGELRLMLSLPEHFDVSDKKRDKITSVYSALRQLWSNSAIAERRDASRYGKHQEINTREADGRLIHMVENLPELIEAAHSEVVESGTFFGEISALTRAPRAAMIVAESDAVIYELRWQGLRDLRKWDAGFRIWVDRLLAQRNMLPFFTQNKILRHLPPEQILAVAEHASFEQLGDTHWYRKSGKISSANRVNSAEEIIMAQGSYLDGVLLIRGGFVRVMESYGSAERTIGVLTENQMYGLHTVLEHHKNPQRPLIMAHTIKAMGYVDLLRIPTHIVISHILPILQLKGLVSRDLLEQVAPAFEQEEFEHRDQALLETLLDKHIINGTATMLIDMDRCVGCDDCVRACATAHDNNPRFIRHGTEYANLQFTNACMQCRDPVCTVDCPTGAIVRKEGTRVITINDTACIGCGNCARSCPYDNIRLVTVSDQQGRLLMNEETNQPIKKATKCDLCVDQLGGPACARACPHDALTRIDTSDPKALRQWLDR